MHRYACYQPHFFLLGKNETAKDINIALKYGYVEITIDYAERLKFEFDHEVMFEHLGNSCSLSIKGCCAWFLPNPNNMEMNKTTTAAHCHFSSKQENNDSENDEIKIRKNCNFFNQLIFLLNGKIIIV